MPQDFTFHSSLHGPLTPLDPGQQSQYQEKGYVFPIRVMDEPEAANLAARFEEYFRTNWARIKGRPAREHSSVLIETHLLLNWVYRVVSHPRLLDAVESVLGPNLLVWSSGWIPKMPGDKKYVSWHQDATYWGLHPPKAVTAWIAFSESTPDNGCMRVIPATHRGPILPQEETYAENNVLSRGQEISVDVDESKAVDLILRPGQMSLHHIGLVHGSKPNESAKPRIGLAVRYISTEVVQDVTVKQCATLVRGKDEFKNFQVVAPPDDDQVSAQDEQRREDALSRMRANNLTPKKH
jgi:non-haem Fe2+, alpha-ketoglutarate-dependent halogenase